MWTNSLCDFSNAKDPGVNCCAQHCFCGVCIWGSALEAVNVKGAEAIATSAIIGQILSSSNNDVIQAFGQGKAAAAFISGRRRLVKAYNIEESYGKSACIRICCAPCAQFQEINTVMHNENLVYGCAELRKDPSVSVPPPKPQTMIRSQSERNRRP